MLDIYKHVIEKIEVDVEKTVCIEICKEDFEDEIDENVVKTKDASKQ